MSGIGFDESSHHAGVVINVFSFVKHSDDPSILLACGVKLVEAMLSDFVLFLWRLSLFLFSVRTAALRWWFCQRCLLIDLVDEIVCEFLVTDLGISIGVHSADDGKDFGF